LPKMITGSFLPAASPRGKVPSDISSLRRPRPMGRYGGARMGSDAAVSQTIGGQRRKGKAAKRRKGGRLLLGRTRGTRSADGFPGAGNVHYTCGKVLSLAAGKGLGS